MEEARWEMEENTSFVGVGSHPCPCLVLFLEFYRPCASRAHA